MFWRYPWNDDTRARLRRIARGRPWDRVAPQAAEAALRLQGMLADGESKLLFELACGCCSGRGAVVDAGSFLGKSASLLAAGLRANGHVPPAMKKVHCYDSFLVHESGTVDFIEERLGHEVAIGESTRRWFDGQTAPVHELLEVHAGDFLDARWSDGPIELLLVDIAKSQQLWARVLEQMFPSLVPGVSMVVHQDYHHTRLPHIHVVMEFLHPCFEIVIPRVDSSAVFLTTKPIPRAMLEKAIRYDFTAEERETLMDAAIARIPPDQRFVVRCAKVVLLAGSGRNLEELLTEIDRLEQDAAVEGPAETPALRGQLGLLASLRGTIVREIGWNALWAGNWPRALEIAERLEAGGEDDDTVLMRGCGLIGLGRHREAEECLRRAPVAVTSASPYVPVELARAVLAQGRHDEAERTMVEGLERLCTDTADRGVLTRHIDVLLEVFAARGDRDKDRVTVESLRRLLPDDTLLERFADERGAPGADRT